MAQTLRPLALNSGNVVSVGMILYRSQFKLYGRLALIATLWYILPILLMAALIAIATLSQISYYIYPLIVLGCILLGILFWARAMLNTSLISRLAFMDLMQQPESVQYARKRLKPKTWGIFATHVLTFFILSGVQTAVAIVLTPVLATVLAATLNMPWLGMVMMIIGQLVPLLAYLAGYACFFIPEVPIAVEPSTNAAQSVGRSGQLSFRSFVHVTLVIGILAVISLPFYGLAMTVPTILFTILANQMMGFEPGVVAPPMYREVLLITGLGALLFLLANLVIMPLWQIVKAVLYYDLRSRHEGFDLSLREVDSQPPANLA